MPIIPETFKVKVNQTLVKSENCYKGPFATVNELLAVPAYTGDYADCYETQTRFQYENGQWVNTNIAIALNPEYLQTNEASVVANANTIVQRDANGAINASTPITNSNVTTKQYVDNALANIDLSEIESEIDVLKTQMANTSNSLIGINEDITTNTNDIDELTNTVANQKTLIDSNTQSIANTNNIVSSNKTQTDNAIAQTNTNVSNLSNKVDGLETSIDNKIDKSISQMMVTDVYMQHINSKQGLDIHIDTVELSTGDGYQKDLVLPIADTTQVGIVSTATMQQIANNTTNINTLNTNVDKNVINNVAIDAQANNVNLTSKSINIKTGAITNNANIALPIASSTQMGLMPKESYELLGDLSNRVNSLEGETSRYYYSASENPTAAQIDTFAREQGKVPPFAGVAIIVAGTYHIWRYYENNNIGWRDDGVDTVQQATNTSLGIVKGSDSYGKIFVENDGSMSLNGWDTIINDVNNAANTANNANMGVFDLTAQINIERNRINSLQTAVTDNTTSITANETAISDLQTSVSTNTSAISTINTKVNTLETTVGNSTSGLVKKVNDNATAIEGLNTSVEAAQTSANDAKTIANAKYSKPSTGIPQSDLSSDVSTKLNNIAEKLRYRGTYNSTTTYNDYDCVTSIDNGPATFKAGVLAIKIGSNWYAGTAHNYDSLGDGLILGTNKKLDVHIGNGSPFKTAYDTGLSIKTGLGLWVENAGAMEPNYVLSVNMGDGLTSNSNAQLVLDVNFVTDTI